MYLCQISSRKCKEKVTDVIKEYCEVKEDANCD